MAAPTLLSGRGGAYTSPHTLPLLAQDRASKALHHYYSETCLDHSNAAPKLLNRNHFDRDVKNTVSPHGPHGPNQGGSSSQRSAPAQHLSQMCRSSAPNRRGSPAQHLAYTSALQVSSQPADGSFNASPNSVASAQSYISVPSRSQVLPVKR